MKNIYIIIFGALVILPAISSAQTFSLSAGYSYSYGNVKDSKNNFEISATILNVYIGYGSNLKGGVGENQYGSAGVSDNYRNISMLLGYAIGIGEPMLPSYFPNTKSNRFYITPAVGFLVEEQLYNDEYYGRDVAESKWKPQLGVVASYLIKKGFMMSVKLTNYNIGISIGAYL